MWLIHRYREQARSHMGLWVSQPLHTTQKTVGASLLAKASAHPTSSQTDPPLSRASSLPHGIVGIHSLCIRHKKPVGASLLAKASAHPTSSQTDPPLSRASPLPQEERVHPKLGRLLGRLASAFDLRRPVKPRWPNAGIAQWASRHGCRDSRAGPWMALRGGPRSNAGERACRA